MKTLTLLAVFALLGVALATNNPTPCALAVALGVIVTFGETT